MKQDARLTPAGEWYRYVAEWRRYVQERGDLDPTVRLVGCFIADRLNPVDDVTWHKQSTIAEKLGVSPHTVMRCLGKLESEGLIKVTRGRRGVKRAVNRYELLYPWSK